MDEKHIYSENAERETLFQLVRLSIDTEHFINTHPVGKVIMERAKDAIMASRMALEKVSPIMPNDISDLQLEIQAARNVIGWLGEAIAAGKNAENQLKILDQEELE